jgi:biotin carboxyl carrier protein
MKRNLLLAVMAIGLAAFISLGVWNIRTTNHKVQLKDIQLQDTSNDLKLNQLKAKELNDRLQKELNKSSTDQQKIQQLEQDQQKAKEREQQLQSQLQAKLDAKNAAAQKEQQVATSIPGTAVASAASSGYMTGCGDNASAAFIYGQESGGRVTGRCNPGAVNGGGCYGIGQDCNGIVRNQCGTDYACQNAYFNDYAVRRYGSWGGAEQFWRANGWW